MPMFLTIKKSHFPHEDTAPHTVSNMLLYMTKRGIDVSYKLEGSFSENNQTLNHGVSVSQT